MGKMVFIFPILDKVDVFVHESGGKVGKNTPSQLTTNLPWDFVVLDFERLDSPKLRGVGGLNLFLGSS